MDDSKGLAYFFLGVGIGVAVGMIFAPQSGAETRGPHQVEGQREQRVSAQALRRTSRPGQRGRAKGHARPSASSATSCPPRWMPASRRTAKRFRR